MNAAPAPTDKTSNNAHMTATSGPTAATAELRKSKKKYQEAMYVRSR
jgi:hypothetical protein